MQSDVIVPAIHARLAAVLAPPSGSYLPFVIEKVAIGWVDDERASRLAAFDDIFDVRDGCVAFRPRIDNIDARNDAVDGVARALSSEGLLSAWRDERYAVAATFGGSALMLLERAAARYFGIRTYATHINGLVRQATRNAMWLGRRSVVKAIDPGLLDNLVGGGIAADLSVQATAVKEAWEEAGITAAIARRAQPAGAVHLCRAQPDGLQRETIFVSDLWLDADFAPANKDGEVVAFRCVPLAVAARLIGVGEGDEVVTADASLVILDCLLRHGAIAPDVPLYLELEALRHPPMEVTRGRGRRGSVRPP